MKRLAHILAMVTFHFLVLLSLLVFFPLPGLAQRKQHRIPAISGGAEASHLAQKATNLSLLHGSPLTSLTEEPFLPGNGFLAYNYDDNATETGNVYIPPDPIGAAGNDRVIAVVNAGIECRTKTGGVIFRDSLRDLFSSLGSQTLGTFTFDPKVLYDSYENRFVVVTLEKTEIAEGDSGDESRILIAVSRTSAPATATTADWSYLAIDSKVSINEEAHWADFPGLALDEEAIYVTANMFTFDPHSMEGVRLWIVDKGTTAGFYSGGTPSFAVYNPIPSGFSDLTTMIPALVFGEDGIGPSIGTYLLGYGSLTDGGVGASESVQIIRIDNPLSSPTFIGQYVDVGDLEDVGGTFGFPDLPGAPQDGTTTLISTNDSRGLDAVWRSDDLWFTTTINPNTAYDTDNAEEATAHWFRFSTSNPSAITIADQGDIGGEDIAPHTATFFPSVAVNGAGETTFGFSASAASIYCGAYYASREPGDAQGTVRPAETVQAGLDYYQRTFGESRNRWGDFSGTAVDPADDTTFWIFNEYADARGSGSAPEDGRWGTAWRSIPSQEFTVAGRVTTDNFTPITDVILSGFPDPAVSATDGTYSIQVERGWSGTVVPSKANYTFAPAQRAYDAVTSDISTQDYVGTYVPPTIVLHNLYQMPEYALPGQPYHIYGEAYYADDTPNNWTDNVPLTGGIVEFRSGDCSGDQQTFTDYHFATPVCTAPDVSTNISLRVIDTTKAGYVDDTYHLDVSSETASVILDSPALGDIWPIGTTQTLAWHYVDPADRYSVEFYISRDDGVTWGSTPFASTSSNTTERWIVSGPATNTARIKIVSQVDPIAYDVSGRFTISETTTLVANKTLTNEEADGDEDTELAFSPDGSQFAYRADVSHGGVIVCDTRAFVQTKAFGIADGALAFAPSGRYLAWLGNGQLYVWDFTIEDWALDARSLEGPKGKALVWISEDQIALIGDSTGSDLEVRVYSRTGNLERILAGPTAMRFQTLAFGGNYLYASGFPDVAGTGPYSGDGTYIYRWPTSTWTQNSYPVCLGRIYSMELSPSVSYLLSAGDDDSGCDDSRPNVRLLNSSNLTSADGATWWGTNKTIRGIAWNPTGTMIAGVSGGGDAAVFDSNLNVAFQVESQSGISHTSVDAAWSSKGVLAIAGNAGSSEIKLYAPSDATAPTITLNSAKTLGSATISGSVADDVAVSSLTISIDSNPELPITLNADGTFDETFENLEQGSHSAQLEALDLAGNTAIEQTTLNVLCTIPSAVVLVEPADRVGTSVTPVYLSWNRQPDAESYDVFIGSTCDTGNIYSAYDSLYAADIMGPGIYYWKVRGRTICDTVGLWSECRSLSFGVSYPDSFVDVTTGPLGDTGGGEGVAWGDYDNDGDLDIYLANYQGNKLLRNDGNGIFTDVTSGPLGDSGEGYGVAWGDYDNDGDLDLYVANYQTYNRLLRNDGGGTFVDATTGPLWDAGGGHCVAWGDYDNDGDLDLYLSNAGANRLFRNDGGDTWVEVATGTPLADTGNGGGVAWGDYDNDGDLDLYLVNTSTANKLFRNEGGGSFVDATTGPLGDGGVGGAAAWGDYDNDGYLDLYLSNILGTNRLFHNERNGTFSDVTAGPLEGTQYSSDVTWGDYDNDGDLDLFIANSGPPNQLLRNDGNGVFTDGTTGPLVDTPGVVGAAWGDYDNDGDLDLYQVSNFQANKLMRNDVDNGNHWLEVNLVGTVSNKDGIGARVRIVAGGQSQIRDVNVGSGRCSQNSLTAEFGIGMTTQIDSLIVKWPSGIVQVVDSVPAADQKITVLEPEVDGITVNIPNGGESWLVGSSQDITWSSTGSIDSVDIDYSTDGGASYQPVAIGVPNSGTYSSWTVPDEPSSNCLIGIRDAADGVPSDVSDSEFGIEPSNWVDATSGPLGDPGGGMGVAWGDYDNDGDLDLYLTNNQSANKLLRNEGSGVFVDATSGPLGDAGSGCSAWGDYDNDGYLDLYTANSDGANKLLHNDGDGTFSDATSDPVGDTESTTDMAWADYNNDGDLDLYLVEPSSSNKLFRNNGNGVFADVTTAPLNVSGSYYRETWADYDNDGDVDLFLVSICCTEPMLFQNMGANGFVSVSAGFTPPQGLGWASAWGDYDNDGDLDVFVVNASGRNQLYRNDRSPSGSYSFSDVTTPSLACTEDDRGAAWGDFDNDGDLDLYVASWGYANTLLRNDGNNTFTDVTNGPLGDTGKGAAVAWGDFDNDGDLDLYLANWGSENKLFRNDAAAGRHWLQVKLQGTVSNWAGIGARVRVVAGGGSQIREISGGSGFWSQDAMVASFGLGSTIALDSLIVRWPSGIVQVVDPVPAVDQAVMVQESQGPATGVEPPGQVYRNQLLAAIPNPFNPRTTIRFELEHASHATLRVFDVAGRLVTTLINETQTAGMHEVIWQGKDSNGRQVATGVYLYRLQAGDFVETKRMVLLK